MGPLKSMNPRVIVGKIAVWPPLCNLGRRFEHRNGGQRPFFGPSPNFGPKNGLNLIEDLYFWFSPNFGQENGFFWARKFLFWSLLFSNILNFLPPPPPPPPPLSKILRMLLITGVIAVMFIKDQIGYYS